MKHKFSILKKHISVSCETLEKLSIYFELLHSWQKKMNLVSNNSLENAETRHFLDSAQLYIFCKNLSGNIVDFGAGAGFPGAVLSIFVLVSLQLELSSKFGRALAPFSTTSRLRYFTQTDGFVRLDKTGCYRG